MTQDLIYKWVADLGREHRRAERLKNTGIRVTGKRKSRWTSFSKRIRKQRKACEECGSKENLVCHHLKRWQEYPHLRFNETNIKVLCQPCHLKAERGIDYERWLTDTG